jgi:pimeloyl-ACP methyl ester carboxylesterase
LHPLGADRHVWDDVVPLLAASRELISIDLPGFGRSPALPPGTTPTPAALARAVSGFLDAAGLEYPAAVGNSLGGWVALELGLADRVRSVLAIAPAGMWRAPLAPKPPIAHILSRAGRPLITPATISRAGRRLLLAGAVAHPERVGAAQAAQLIRAYATASDFRRVNAAMRNGVFSELERIPVPVTLVWPEHDGLVVRPPALPDHIASVTLPGVGHIPMLESPREVAALILAATDPTDSPALAGGSV